MRWSSIKRRTSRCSFGAGRLLRVLLVFELCHRIALIWPNDLSDRLAQHLTSGVRKTWSANFPQVDALVVALSDSPASCSFFHFLC